MLSEGSESIDERKVRVYIYQLWQPLQTLQLFSTMGMGGVMSH